MGATAAPLDRLSQRPARLSASRTAASREITHQTRATGEVAAPPLGVIEGFKSVG
jgi:hypothetical protein